MPMNKKRAAKAGACLFLGAAGLGGLYLLRPPCLILKMTGLRCAGCGTQRMISRLLRGDLLGAWGYNPYMFVVLPLAAFYALWEALRYVREKPPLRKTRPAQMVLLAVLLCGVGFMVLRNLTP